MTDRDGCHERVSKESVLLDVCSKLIDALYKTLFNPNIVLSLFSFLLQKLYHVPASHGIFVTGVEFLPVSSSTRAVTGKHDFNLLSISPDYMVQIHQPSEGSFCSSLEKFLKFILIPCSLPFFGFHMLELFEKILWCNANCLFFFFKFIISPKIVLNLLLFSGLVMSSVYRAKGMCSLSYVVYL